jgi:hypothetical protein
MPPGWSHTGEHKMAHLVRRKYFEESSVVHEELPSATTV